jgi:hypothetical protein
MEYIVETIYNFINSVQNLKKIIQLYTHFPQMLSCWSFKKPTFDYYCMRPELHDTGLVHEHMSLSNNVLPQKFFPSQFSSYFVVNFCEIVVLWEANQISPLSRLTQSLIFNELPSENGSGDENDSDTAEYCCTNSFSRTVFSHFWVSWPALYIHLHYSQLIDTEMLRTDPA